MYDGILGHPGQMCDIGIWGNRITAIGNLSGLQSKRRIECKGLSMMPGLIDVHTHSDLVYFVDPSRSMAIQQGITTEICSACGIGVIPLNGDLLKTYHKGVFKYSWKSSQ